MNYYQDSDKPNLLMNYSQFHYIF